MSSTPGVVNYPTSLDDVVSLIQAANNAATALTSSVTSGDTSLPVTSTTGFAATGVLSIDDEIIAYTSTTSTSFGGLTRGVDSTTAAAHTNGASVEGRIVALHHNTLAAAIIATETQANTLAPLASPALTGNPTAPTQTAGNNSTRVATTAYTDGAVTTSYTAVATLTNKRLTRRVGTTTSSATPTINTDNVDIYSITALAAAVTSFTTNLSGTPVNGDVLLINITDNGTARTLAWGSKFEASGIVPLPTTTVASTRVDIIFIWNAVTSKWRCIGVA